MDKLNIAVVTSEAVPFAKTGGLADVSGVLPGLLAGRGHRVKMFMPRYRQVATGFTDLETVADDFDIPVGETRHPGQLSRLVDNDTGLEIYFIGNDFFFNRQELYRELSTGRDYEDNDNRFIFFSRMVIEALRRLGWAPDIVHANDWQAALVPAYLKTVYKNDPVVGSAATVFTVHNLAYQGQFPAETFDKLGIDPAYFGPVAPFEYWGKVNLMKAAVVLSDLVTTVSPTYAGEIRTTSDYGMGLEGVLDEYSDKLIGILNGVDYDTWSPRTDRLIPHRYFKDNLSGKKKNKLELLHRSGFPIRLDHPLFGMISRLDSQKGFDLIVDIIDEMMQMDLQFVLLGTGNLKYHQVFTEIAGKYPDKFQAYLQFDNQLAHLIEAGSDIFMMPSRYEPCGLNQMYSLRYGTVPLVRKTGGLADTVDDFDETTRQGTGFVFEEYTAEALLATVKRAVRLFNKKRLWYKIVKQGMIEDFSWEMSARKYETAYLKLLGRQWL